MKKPWFILLLSFIAVSFVLAATIGGNPHIVHRDIIEYDYVKEHLGWDFNDMMDQKIAEGWEPLGDVLLTLHPPIENVDFTQAIVKYAPVFGNVKVFPQKIVDYELVWTEPGTTPPFVEKVNQMISEGWVPYGTILYQAKGHQVMVKYE